LLAFTVYFNAFSEKAANSLGEWLQNELPEGARVTLVQKHRTFLSYFKRDPLHFKSYIGQFALLGILQIERTLLKFNTNRVDLDWKQVKRLDRRSWEETPAISDVCIFLGVERDKVSNGNLKTIVITLSSGFTELVSDLGWATKEVINKEPSTSVSAKFYMPGDHSEPSFEKIGRYPTMHSIGKNRDFVNLVAVEMCIDLLRRSPWVEKIPSSEDSLLVPSQEYSPLSTWQVLNYVILEMWNFAACRINLWFSLLKKSSEWHVAITLGPWQNLTDVPITIIPNPLGRSLADPFIVNWNGQTAIFVEDIDLSIGKGSISAILLDGSQLYEVLPCIKEDFHMSFPFTFEWQGDLFMCPETSRASEIRIYRCTNFPFGWEFAETIIDDTCAVDTVLFPWNDLWWMLTGISDLGAPGRMSELHCFYSTDPISKVWHAHELGVVVRDSTVGRNGGLILGDGSVYRVRQAHGFQQYGYKLTVSKISILSKEFFQETEIMGVKPKKNSSIKAIHHLSSNGGYTAFDFLAPKGFDDKSGIFEVKI